MSIEKTEAFLQLCRKNSITIANTILQRLDGERILNFRIQLIKSSRPKQITKYMKFMKLLIIPQNLQDISLIL